MGSITSNLEQQNVSLAPSAYVASPRILEDPAWFIDSGASNHVTTDKVNLHTVKKYEGKEKLLVGD